jgi:integrase
MRRSSGEPKPPSAGRSIRTWFRDCAATSIAIEDPKHVRIASQILGHRSTATTERYYNQARAIDAARRYQDFLLTLRGGRMRKDPEPVESR